MFNDFQLAMIAGVLIASLFIYWIMKRSSISHKDENQSENDDLHDKLIQEQVEIVSQIKEEPKQEEMPATVDELKDSLSRRKCDTIIPRREVPAHIKITKQNFAEFAGERILVAEDNLINQKVILGLLAESGIDLVMANDGQEALDILDKDSDFVMILMDAHMPRVDGFEATRIIRENPKYDHILIVALSGDTATDDIQKMKDAGMAEQLAKPLRIEELYKIIYAYTGKETDQSGPTGEDGATKNLDIDKGLETCGGDEGFYREILSEFITDYADSSDRLGEFLRTDDFHSADALLLDIIGISENIGAHPLGISASNMKQALKDTDEKSYFSLFDQYRIHLDRLIQDIREYLQ